MSKKDGDVFSVDKLRELLELMKEFDLTEIDLVQADQEIRFSRGGKAPVMMAPAAAPQPVMVAPAQAASEAAKPVADGAHIKVITAPMVGTFYSKPKPESEDFVKVGAKVSADTVICIVEAMKVFNEIPAEVSGTIVEVMARNEDAVDFGRPLFKVDTRG
ncbi:MAG: acetyl-CoA carboxylase biotin carboxyl carrier protein [Pirellulales bacterium]